MKRDYEFTKREILFSIIIVFVMLGIGFLINSFINDSIADRNEEYIKAVEINNKDLFNHGMNTNVGNAFVYGTLNKVDTVSYDEIKDKDYIHIEKYIEKYTRHSRQVKHTSGKKTWYTTEYYWTWDNIGYDDKTAKEITFMGNKYKIDKISNVIDDDYIDTIHTGYHLREKYYGAKLNNVKGTIYCNLKNKTINNATFHKGMKIKECKESYMINTKADSIIFWIFCIGLIVFVVYQFGMLQNDWLEDKKKD